MSPENVTLPGTNVTPSGSGSRTIVSTEASVPVFVAVIAYRSVSPARIAPSAGTSVTVFTVSMKFGLSVEIEVTNAPRT